MQREETKPKENMDVSLKYLSHGVQTKLHDTYNASGK